MNSYFRIHICQPFPPTRLSPLHPSSPLLMSLRLQGIINLILATDMARHSEILADFDRLVVSGFSFSNEEHIKQVSQSLACVH